MTQNVKWKKLISYGQELSEEFKEQSPNNPWIRVSGDVQYITRPGFKSERTITLNDGENVQVFSTVCHNQNVPLFKCTCPAKSLDVTTTTPTQAANRILEMLGLKTNKHWSGPVFFGFVRKDVLKHLCINNGKQNQSSAMQLDENNMNLDNNVQVSSQQEFCSIPPKTGTLFNWLGVKNIGENSHHLHSNNTSPWFYVFQDKYIPLQPGYDARNAIYCNGKSYDISCKIVRGVCNLPAFQCQVFLNDNLLHTCNGSKPTTAFKDVLRFLNLECTRNISGYEFWGLQRNDVNLQLQLQSKKRQRQPEPESNDQVVKKNKNYQYPLLEKASKTRTRNAGPTESLKKGAQKDRNALIHDLVKFASFNDVQSFITFMCDNEPDTVFMAMESSDSFVHTVTSKLNIVGPKDLSAHQSAEFILGRTHLSQREYNAARKYLKKANVHLAKYVDATSYTSRLEVGNISQHKHSGDFEYTGSDCLCAGSDFNDTMQRVINTDILYQKLEFPSKSVQKNVFEHLKVENPQLYGKLDPDNRTFFLRETGDNFRGSSKQPTEQMSFNILNLTDLISSPYGQFVSSIWRGPETRKYIRAHVSSHYESVTAAVKHGLTLKTGDNVREKFNVVVFFVVDLGHLKETLGKCTCTATYGCYWCKKKTEDWAKPIPSSAPLQTIIHMVELGQKAEEKLGKEPDKSSTEYKKFQQANLSQTVCSS